MKIVLFVSIVIIFIVIWLTVITTNKAYSIQHSVDPHDGNPFEKKTEKGEI